VNDDDPDSSSTSTEPNSRSLLDRIGQALLGEPGNRKELIDILRDAQHRDLLSADDLDMIEGVFQVSEMQVRDIMIPRAQMDVVDRDREPEEYLPEVIETAHSRFPMIDDDKDKIIGILLAKDLLRYFYQKDKEKKSRLDIEDFLRPAVFVPESKRLNVLLREFRTSRNHMAIVVNEYGGVAGLVTIEDVLEQIVGEIADEHDIDGEDVMIMPHDHGECTVKALTSLEEFNAHFGTRFQDDDYETVAGLIMTTLGHLPERGEKVLIEGLQFEVLRADSRRIHILKVKPIAESAKRA